MLVEEKRLLRPPTSSSNLENSLLLSWLSLVIIFLAASIQASKTTSGKLLFDTSSAKFILSARESPEKTLKKEKWRYKMEISLELKSWEVVREGDDNKAKIKGEYTLKAGSTIVAKQSFNSYGGTDVGFSNDLLKKIIEIEKEIKLEIKGLLA